MSSMQPPLLLLLLLLLATTVSSCPTPLQPKQLKALESLNISTTNRDPCNHRSSSIACDSASPFRHVISLSFTNCSSDLSLSSKTLKPFSKSLLSLSFHNCPSLSHSGHIPNRIGGLIHLKNLSLASNRLTGLIPISLSLILELTYLDLSMNQLNGTVPVFFSKMKNLKHLNLADNSFHGVLPFKESFIKKLQVFEIRGNSDLCYNDTVLSSKLKLDIAPCGSPLSPLLQKEVSTAEEDNGDYAEEESSNKIVFRVAIGLLSLVLLIIFLILLAKRCRWF